MAENLTASSQGMLQVTALHEVIADLYKLEPIPPEGARGLGGLVISRAS